jgi:hypothetical protein
MSRRLISAGFSPSAVSACRDGAANCTCFSEVLRTDRIRVLRLPRGLSRRIKGWKSIAPYVLDQDGRIELRVDLFCSGVEAARERVRQIVNGRDVQLWQGVHPIETFKATH